MNIHFRDRRQFADKIFTTIFPRLGGDSAIEAIPGKQLFALKWSDPEKANERECITAGPYLNQPKYLLQ